MEAASARMAARDRFRATGNPGPSTLQRYIQSACDPQNFEPNLALNLEIADLINSKKGNAPREAAVAIVNLINHRNPNVSLLALALLDICVKNCGYPFHLQISTKEFLNELVRRFPEHPPIRPSRVQNKILEALEEWRQTICQTSKYKEDLGYVRDMHRLLLYKGYMFPEVRREDAAVLNPSDNLKSAEEMEQEERAAQSAKLQELIRRGTPEDLQEANRLMKVMAGYDTKHKTDYRAKAAEEVGKIQQKAKLLEERLQQFKEGDTLAEGDVYEELASSLQSAQPKIQRMCEEESDDAEAVAKLLEINDSIHRTIERYKLVKKGDVQAASKIPKGTLGTSTGVTKSADNELSLIDLDGETESNVNGGSSSSVGKKDSIEDDLLGLNIQGTQFGQGGGIALGIGPRSGGDPYGQLQTSSTSQPNTAKIPTRQPQQTSQVHKPNYDPFASLASPPSQSAAPFSSIPKPPETSAHPAPVSDPFAILSDPTPRQASPFIYQQQTTKTAGSATPSLFDTSQPSVHPGQQQAAQQNNGVTTDEEWTFASSLPDQALPSVNEVAVTNTAVNIVFAVSRPAGDESTIMIMVRSSNNTDQPISEFTFQIAVTKSCSLQLTPQSGRSLQPHQRNGITQLIRLNGVDRGNGNSVKLRWKVSYKVGAAKTKEEQGEIVGLGIS